MIRVLAPLALLAACAAADRPVWLKPGVEAATAEQEFLSCAAAAQAQFPAATGIATAPRITLGGRVCEGSVCIGAAGPDVFDYDRNDSLRDRAIAACMGAKGYDLATLPACSGAVTPLRSHPFDARGVCVTGDGTLAAR
ncbi:hypothetical protein ACK8OR_02930 [Jannaschia sp. KMU-145]|uniref:hypothetical protein n=1 Tax=Jannaschia halovivens TaxID=3388667 RepID=UPI00396B1C1B